MITDPFSAREVASRLGYRSVGTLYRNEAKLIAAGMPASTNPCGKRAYDRAAMEAWLTRNDPRRPRQMCAANDVSQPPMPSSDAEWNTFLHQHYSREHA